ncbi:Clp protease ClpP [Paracoccus sp. MBLB3053]|uniref:Clp protease ClpP n=1 Tax=Paracoccus aurantius TaxID=3073814 RepID=A0ABU2HSR1_9RHOB|nr:head maturation protease, ClpP-related [Paracoccus sp. MBLB3053]MDS9467344.1 Clp protease ClpP [Paracoccus sp. MBLB3053]
MNELRLYGTVGSSFWDEEYFTARQVREQLDAMSGPLTVRVNSGGGIATEGQAIYTALRAYEGDVHVIVEGVAASAASLIAMAGDTITMTLGAIMMIHDPASWYVEGRGTEEDHLQAAAGLGVIANAYAGIYARRAGIKIDEARAIMKAETYYDGAAAVAAGFATATDEESDELAPAAFDYRIYGHAPQQLLAVAGAIQRERPVSAVMAMMARAATPTAIKGDHIMAKPKVTAVTAAEEGDQDGREEMETQTEDETTASATNPGSEDEKEDGDDAAQAALGADAVAILHMCERKGVGVGSALEMIGRGLTCAQAAAELQGTQMTINNHAPRTRILRDERDTVRMGMTGAIIAQLQGQREVTGPASAYMGMSIVEMASASIGHRGSMRSWGEKEQVMMQAMHTTSDFPAIFENALNKQLLEKYQLAAPTYRQISRKRNFRDFRPMPLVRTGDFPTLKPINEAGEIKWGTFGEGREQAVISSYGVGVSISRQMMINDELGAIDEVLSNYGMTVALFEESTFYAFALAATMADGNAIFHATHGNLGSGGAASAINTAAVAAGRAAMRKQKSVDGNTLNIVPNILLVGPDKETEAEMFVAAITPTATANVNPFSGRLTPVVTAEISGNAWYLLSSANPCWVHGYLEGSEAPRLRTEEPFGRQGLSMTLEHDFGMGAADYRGGYKNNGA